MQSGKLKYFASRKKLSTVEYLQNVRAICNCQDGFALIETSADGMEIFIEFHPDAFPRIDEDVENKNKYDISFEQNACKSTWNNAHFLIKELSLIKAADNKKFIRCLLPDIENELSNLHRPIFFVIDHNLLSFHVNPNDGSHFVHQLISCSAKIRNFWMTDDGNAIILLLESGAIECLTLNVLEQKLCSQKIYLNSTNEIVTSDFNHDILTYSDGYKVYHGALRQSTSDGLFKYQCQIENICGVAALTILCESDIVLCISENHVFYVISLVNDSTDSKAEQWIEVDTDIHRDIHEALRQNVFELNETHVNLCSELVLQKAMSEAATLRSCCGSDERFFIANVKAFRSLPEYSLAQTTIYVSNNLILDHQSYFLRISLVAQKYSEEFNSPLWNLRVRWHCGWNCIQQTYVNVKLTKEGLLKPLDIVMHMKEGSDVFVLPELHIDINAPIHIGQDFLYISFPVNVQQAKITDVLEVHRTKPVLYRFGSCNVDLPKALSAILPIESRKAVPTKHLLYRIKLPSTITIEHIYSHNEFRRHLRGADEPHKQLSQIFYIVILSSTLEMAYNQSTHDILLTTTNAGILIYIKKLLYHIIIGCLPSSKTFHLPAAIPKEYCVSC